MTAPRLLAFAAGLALVLGPARGQPPIARQHAALVHAVALSPDGKTLATAGFDNLVKLWSVGSDGTLKELKSLPGHTGPVYAVAFHPKENVLASASLDKTVRLWDLDDGKLLVSAGGGDKDQIKVWDVAAQKELKVLKGHDQPVTGVVFAGDPKTLVSVSMDRTIRVWDVAEGKETKKLGPTPDDPYAVAWSPKSKLLGVCGYSGLVSAWDPAEDKPRFTKAIKSPGYCVAFTADGKRLISGHDNGSVVVTPITGK